MREPGDPAQGRSVTTLRDYDRRIGRRGARFSCTIDNPSGRLGQNDIMRTDSHSGKAPSRFDTYTVDAVIRRPIDRQERLADVVVAI